MDTCWRAPDPLAAELMFLAFQGRLLFLLQHEAEGLRGAQNVGEAGKVIRRGTKGQRQQPHWLRRGQQHRILTSGKIFEFSVFFILIYRRSIFLGTNLVSCKYLP